MVFITGTAQLNCLVLGDSILRGLEDILHGCMVRSISGARFSTLRDAVSRDWGVLQTNLQPHQIDILMLHVGTNDIWEDLPTFKQHCFGLLHAVFHYLP